MLLFAELAKRLGVKTKMVTDEELLDLGLLKAMEEGRSSKFVSTDIIMQKLKGNADKISGDV